MDAFGPIKGAVGTAAVVGSLGSLASEKAKENKLTEKQQELDKREEIANLKQASVNTEGDILNLNKERGSKAEELSGLHRQQLKELAGYKKAEGAKPGNTVEAIRSQYTDKRTGKQMSEEKAKKIQSLKFNKAAAREAIHHVRDQIDIKVELNQIRAERIKELQGVKTNE